MAVKTQHQRHNGETTAARPELQLEHLQVRHLMSTTPVTISPEASVREAERLMQRTQANPLVVVRDGQLMGLLTDLDVQTVLPSPATSFSKGELLYLLEKLAVRQAMTSDVVTVTPDCSVSEAVRLMLAHRIGALPVLEARQVVGILHQRDILQALFGTQVDEQAAA